MGGIEHRIHHMSKRLAKEHEVIVLTSRLPGTNEEEWIDGYRVVRLQSRYINLYNPPYVSSTGVLKALEALRPDIVDLHYRWAPSYIRQALRYQGRILLTYHNTFGEGEGMLRAMSYLNDWCFVRKMRRFDRIICISDFVLRDNLRHGIPAAKMCVVPNGVDMPCMPSRDEGFILSLCRMVRTKGLEFLVQAMQDVEGRLVMAGDGPERERLMRMARKLGVKDKIDFPGKVSEKEKADLLASCSIFVLPSLFESYGIAAAEAMSYGKPVVATMVGGLPEVVGDAGILIPPKDSVAIAKAIRQLLEDSTMRGELGRKARERASRYSWDEQAAKLASIYEDVLRERA